MVFKFVFKLLLIFVNIDFINGFDLCVVGASSGLGREIIYQGLNKKNKKNNNMKILGLTSNPENIKIPYRGGGLNNKNNNLLLRSPNLEICEYNDFVNYNFSNIVFISGAQPFQDDYSDIITKKILECKDYSINLSSKNSIFKQQNHLHAYSFIL